VASQSEIAATYDYLDDFWRAAFGRNPDITAALYDGNYDKTLEQAQRDKHRYILEAIRVQPGSVVLDIGCGWGGLLTAVTAMGAKGVGLTLSPRQAAACQRTGLDVRLRDWKLVDRATIGPFDAVASVGAFEHFCSEAEYIAGRQDEIYRRFFQFVASLVPSGARLFLQTMLWGNRVPDPETIRLEAPRRSDEHLLALVRKFYPGSWLPSGVEQIARAAAPEFHVVSTLNGRLDYLQTMREWGRLGRRPRPSQIMAALRALPFAVRDRDFSYRLQAMWHSANQRCFERRVMDHERIVFEKR